MTAPAALTDNTCHLPSTQRGRERREKILAAAESIFFETGYEAASVNEIVKRSGGSLATLYKLFGTKEELFKSLVVSRAQALYETLCVDRLSRLSPSEVLTELGLNLATISLSEHGAAIFRIVMAEGANFPALRDIFITNAIDRVQSDLTKYLQRQIKAGVLDIDEPALAAKQFMEMVKGDMPLRMCCGAPPPTRKAIESQVRCAVKLFLRGAQPRP